MSHENIEQLTNGIFLVTDDAGEESIVTATEAMVGLTRGRTWTGDTTDCADYYERHAVCPKCGGLEEFLSNEQLDAVAEHLRATGQAKE